MGSWVPAKHPIARTNQPPSSSSRLPCGGRRGGNVHLNLRRLALQPVQGGTSSSGWFLAGGNLPQPLHNQAWTIQSFPTEVHQLSRVWPDPCRLQEMRRRVCMEGRRSWTQRLLRGLKMLSVFFLSYSTYKLSCPLK